MTRVVKSSGAPSSCKWTSIDWKKADNQVRRLQMRIAKADREGKRGKVKSLQRLLTHSFYGKALAVKRVTQNKGKSTPGVDGIIWSSNVQKMKAVLSMKRRGYKASPLKRIYILKESGGKRPLSVPTLLDRAMQALYLLALEPIAENRADSNSYGFRQKRSTKDAIEQCFITLARKESPEWILEGDIEKCFDKIDHDWLIDNIPMDKIILRKFLKAGFMEGSMFNQTISGTPQGAIISPTLAVMALSGLEKAIKSFIKTKGSKVNVIIYADDFVVTGVSEKMLEEVVLPIVKSFLEKRGLSLSERKTKITHIDEGFDFLGFNVRKYKGKLLIKPAKASIKKFLKNIRDRIKKSCAMKTEDLINILNPKIRGWGNYFRSVVSSKIFSMINSSIYHALVKWIDRRHPNKGKRWRISKYFRSSGYRHWQFHANVKGEYIDLLNMAKIHIKRHVKIRGDANPYDPEYKDYFVQRDKRYVYHPEGITMPSYRGLSGVR